MELSRKLLQCGGSKSERWPTVETRQSAWSSQPCKPGSDIGRGALRYRSGGL